MQGNGENPDALTPAQLAFLEGISDLQCPMCGHKSWVRAEGSLETGGHVGVLLDALPGGTSRLDRGIPVISYECANPVCRFVRLHRPPPKR